MTQTAWLLLLMAFALVVANLPFLSSRLFLVFKLPGTASKGLAWRLLELLVWFGVTLGLGRVIEGSLGQNQAQGWEFYAVLASLFLTAAFPGFVYRYLLKRAG